MPGPEFLPSADLPQAVENASALFAAHIAKLLEQGMSINNQAAEDLQDYIVSNDLAVINHQLQPFMLLLLIFCAIVGAFKTAGAIGAMRTRTIILVVLLLMLAMFASGRGFSASVE